MFKGFQNHIPRAKGFFLTVVIIPRRSAEDRHKWYKTVRRNRSAVRCETIGWNLNRRDHLFKFLAYLERKCNYTYVRTLKTSVRIVCVHSRYILYKNLWSSTVLSTTLCPNQARNSTKDKLLKETNEGTIFCHIWASLFLSHSNFSG